MLLRFAGLGCALALIVAPGEGAAVRHLGAQSPDPLRLYEGGGRQLAVVDDPYGPPRLVDLDTGEVHALYPEGPSLAIGSGFATRDPVAGRARFDAGGGRIDGLVVHREPVRQLEVRFPSGGAVLSGTLTLPPGRGPHAAVVFLQGSGPTTRAYLPDVQALFLRSGVAVLAYDKRGVGRSGGVYPGESPTPQAIGTLARDAAAAVRFLDGRPEIDARRVGLAGHSEAGWVMPLAAARDSAIRFLVVFSGPTVTADENDRYQTLTGQGERPQQLSDAAVDARVLAGGRGGFDPMPWIRRLQVPVLWLYGGLDKHVPTRLSVRRLESLGARPTFSIRVFPSGNHALVATTTGLTSEMLRSHRFAVGLFGTVTRWLRLHGLATRS